MVGVIGVGVVLVGGGASAGNLRPPVIYGSYDLRWRTDVDVSSCENIYLKVCSVEAEVVSVET